MRDRLLLGPYRRNVPRVGETRLGYHLLVVDRNDLTKGLRVRVEG